MKWSAPKVIIVLIVLAGIGYAGFKFGRNLREKDRAADSVPSPSALPSPAPQ